MIKLSGCKRKGRIPMLMARLFLESNYSVIIAICKFFPGEERSPILISSLSKPLGKKENKHFYNKWQPGSCVIKWFEEFAPLLRAVHTSRLHNNRNDHIENSFAQHDQGYRSCGLQGIQPEARNVSSGPCCLSCRRNRGGNQIEISFHKWKRLNPEVVETLHPDMTRFAGAYQLLQDFVNPVRQSLFKENKVTTEVLIEKKSLEPYLTNAALLYELFQPYHFQKNVLEDLVATWENGTGRIFESYTIVFSGCVHTSSYIRPDASGGARIMKRSAIHQYTTGNGPFGYQQYEQQTRADEGRVRVEYAPSKKEEKRRPGTATAGEFVDFEEIKISTFPC
ncbi:hypothetical protein FQR65_LT17646 [Abscondita terminalis]|nr:hypothetical protein FQR65_LT17646 [Abscondita terminalis]